MRRFPLGARLMVAAAAISAVVVAVTAGGAVADGSATLNFQLFPPSLLPSGTGAGLATFTNNGPSNLNHVTVTVTLPAGFAFDAPDSSPNCSATGQLVTCPLVGGGSISVGTSVLTTIAFTGPNSGTGLTFKSSASVNSQTQGKPNGQPGNQNFIVPGPSPQADVIGNAAAGQSSCKKGGDTRTASAGGQSILVTAGANSIGLTCTPITTGIDTSQSAFFFVKVPLLAKPGTVVLTFSDGNLPFSTDTDADFATPPPAHLYEFPNYPDTTASTEVSVPPCADYSQSTNGPPKSAITADPHVNGGALSTDSCIKTVAPTSDRASDGNGHADFDQGTITLEVTGSSTGDGGYPGHR
jgi:hypothetical protein